MPTVAISIPEIDQSVSRPIIIDIVSQIQDITKIDPNIKIMFSGDANIQQARGTSIDEKGRWAEYGNDKYIQIEATETFDEELLLTNALTQEQHMPIFVDSHIGILIKPSYITTNVVINFKYKTYSKTDAIRWRNDVMSRWSHGRLYNTHKLHYHYPFPREYLTLLQEVHALREATSPYGQDMIGYFQEHASTRIKEIGNLNKTNTELAVTEVQSRVVGYFDFEGAPEKAEKEDDTGAWVISFAYKFRYERPNMCVCRYPIMVHNQLLPSIYTTLNNDVPDTAEDDLYYTVSGNAMQSFEAQRSLFETRVGVDGIVNIPKNDEFKPAESTPGTKGLLIALVSVESDLKTLLNLRSLGDIVLDQDVLDFISSTEYPHITKPNESIYRLELYKNDSLHTRDTITCNSNLDVASLSSLDLRDQHRVKLSIISDLTKLSPIAINRLRLNPPAFLKTIECIYPNISKVAGINTVLSQPTISNANWNYIYRQLTGSIYTNNTPLTASEIALAKQTLATRLNATTTISAATNTPNQSAATMYSAGSVSAAGVWISSPNAILKTTNTFDPNNIFLGINSDPFSQSSLEYYQSTVGSLKTVMSTSVDAYKL